MDLQLTNKVVLVTGSTAGFGFAIGAGLAAEGAKVIINGRSEKRVDEAIAMIRQKHPQARLAACAGDLSDAEAAQRVTTDFPQGRHFGQQPWRLRHQAFRSDRGSRMAWNY